MLRETTKLGDLDRAERSRLPEAVALRFAPIIGQVVRYGEFLRVIFARHQQFVLEHREYIDQIQVLLSRPDRGQESTVAEMAILARQTELSSRLHLEVETFCLSCKIFLDKAAHFIEH